MRRWVLATTLALIILLGASVSAKHSAPHARRISQASPALGMYSRRALRKSAIILQLKLLELREERLERVRRVIEKRLPVDVLFCRD